MWRSKFSPKTLAGPNLAEHVFQSQKLIISVFFSLVTNLSVIFVSRSRRAGGLGEPFSQTGQNLDQNPFESRNLDKRKLGGSISNQIYLLFLIVAYFYIEFFHYGFSKNPFRAIWKVLAGRNGVGHPCSRAFENKKCQAPPHVNGNPDLIRSAINYPDSETIRNYWQLN